MSRSCTQGDSVFDEPHLRPTTPPPLEEGPPLDSIHMEPGRVEASTLYSDWLTKEVEKRTPASAWSLTFLLSLIAGPLAILTAFFSQTQTSQFLLIVIVGPLVEELGKVVAPLMVVEKNPARFTNGLQPVVCAVAGGLVFSVIENLLYLHVYIPDPTPALITWRWTVCVFLHTGCSFLAGCGVAKIRSRSLKHLQPPKMETGAFLILASVAVHGLYNLIALLIDPVFG